MNKNKEAMNLIKKLRKIFENIDDTNRQDLHRTLMKGYCPTCAHKMDGTCWNCWESGEYDSLDL
jgi:hypothetical protein